MSNQAIVLAHADPAPARETLTRHFPTGARIVVGLAFFVFGLDGFLHFIPPPQPGSVPEGAMALATAFAKSGYLLQLVKGTELVAGALLLANRFVPLALVLLAPVLVNILAYHLFLAPSSIAIGFALTLLAGYLAWIHRAAYRGVLAAGGTAQP